jgi:hypothetical protein
MTPRNYKNKEDAKMLGENTLLNNIILKYNLFLKYPSYLKVNNAFKRETLEYLLGNTPGWII